MSPTEYKRTTPFRRARRRVHEWGCEGVHPTRYSTTLLALVIGVILAATVYAIREGIQQGHERDRFAREQRAELRERDRELAAAIARIRALERLTTAEVRALLNRIIDELDEPALRRRLRRALTEGVGTLGGTPPPGLPRPPRGAGSPRGGRSP